MAKPQLKLVSNEPTKRKYRRNTTMKLGHIEIRILKRIMRKRKSKTEQGWVNVTQDHKTMKAIDNLKRKGFIKVENIVKIKSL